MKNILNILTIFALAFLLFSCEKFLDLKPLSEGVAVTNTSADSALYADASEVEAALGGVYDDFRNEYYELDYYVNGDAQSDDAYAGADNPANFQIDDYAIDATNLNVSRDWAYLYSMIGKANTVINNMEGVPGLTVERMNEIKGEACFIRAFNYFQLVQLWGDVPLQLTEIKTISAELLPELYLIMFPPRTSRQKVYEQIIKDLEVAVQYAPATAPHKGYATKGAANALLAKVYVTSEEYRDWNKVLTYCDAVINGGYTLLENYDQLWDGSVENSSESIFEINYEGTPSSGNWGVNMFRGMDWKKFNIPSNDLVAAFDAEGDVIRKNASIIWLDVSGKWNDPNWPQINYPFLNKWRNLSQPSPQNYIFIRLADIILLKAEALNETGDVAGAKILVDQIRSRVNLPGTPAGNQADMRLAIEKERRLELAFEGCRWYDLKRTGRAIEVINKVPTLDGNGYRYNLNPNRLLWPIPQAELDKNVNLVQNPGY